MKSKSLYFLSGVFIILALFAMSVDALFQDGSGWFDKSICSVLSNTKEYRNADESTIIYQCRAVEKKYPSLENWDMYATIVYLVAYVLIIFIINIQPVAKENINQQVLNLSKINFLVSIVALLFLFSLYTPIYESIFAWIIKDI